MLNDLWYQNRFSRRKQSGKGFSWCSEIKFQTHHRRAPPRQFRVQRQRIEPIIAVVDIQNAHAQLHPAARKSVADKDVALPELIARLGWGEARITLRVP